MPDLDVHNNHRFFVSAIGTDSGKTLVANMLCKKLGASYWKPIQCGKPTDSDQVRSLMGETVRVYEERFSLETPASPHYAARNEGIEISVSDFNLHGKDARLVIEGAGGLLVPINSKETMADLISHLDVPVILVVNHYLGSLNHTLLSVSELKRRGILLAGIVFNGYDFQDAESAILQNAGVNCILRLPKLDLVNRAAIDFWAGQIVF